MSLDQLGQLAGIDQYAQCNSTQRAEFRASSYVGDPPCTGCPLAETCKRERMACLEFHSYVETSRIKPRGRYPSRAIFDLIFDGRDLSAGQAKVKQHYLWSAHWDAKLHWINRGSAA